MSRYWLTFMRWLRSECRCCGRPIRRRWKFCWRCDEAHMRFSNGLWKMIDEFKETA